MKALVKTKKGPGHIEVRDVPEPVADQGEARIKIDACGICGSDIHVRHDSFPYWPPVTLGHEFTGEVVEPAADSPRFRAGDRVVAEPHTLACGVCPLCRTGNIQICEQKRSPGWGIDGGMAEFICYPERLLHRIPDDMSVAQAVMVEPTANVVTDLLERTGVSAGDYVVILGPGPIGLLAAMCARAVGARETAIVGTPGDRPLRFPRARQLGFNNLIDAGERDVCEAVMEQTGGAGADVVVECSGAPKAIATLPDLVRKLGKICVIGLTGHEEVQLDWDKFCFKVATVVFNLSTFYTSWDKAIDLIHRGGVRAQELVTHNEPLERWESVFDAIERLEAIKGVLRPGD